MNIINSKQKIKSLIVILIVLLVGLGSFGLGRLSALQEQEKMSGQTKSPENAGNNNEIVIEKTLINNMETAVANTRSTVGPKTYVASRNGTKYYLTTCATANRIKDENKIYFDTETAARLAGYEPSSTCKGLTGN